MNERPATLHTRATSLNALTLMGNYVVTIVAVFLASGVSGCVVPVLQTAADTIVHVREEGRVPEESVTMGLKLCAHARVDNRLVLTCWGGFPREHDTWIYWHLLFTTAHPYPDYHRRIRLTCATPEAAKDTYHCSRYPDTGFVQ